MYFQIWLSILFVYSLVLIQTVMAAGNEFDRRLCKRFEDRCTATSARVGNSDVGVESVNAQCLVIRGPSWRNITRCQLVKAYCDLTIIKCRRWDCKNIESVIRLN